MALTGRCVTCNREYFGNEWSAMVECKACGYLRCKHCHQDHVQHRNADEECINANREQWSDAMLINEATRKFAAVFGLRAWPGRTFRIGRYSYVSRDKGKPVVMLYTDIQREDGTWAEGFAKATVDELKREIISIEATKQLSKQRTIF